MAFPSVRLVPTRAAALAAALVGATFLAAGPSHAASCNVTANPIAFGAYNAVTKTQVTTTTSISASCSGLEQVNYTISLSPGQSGVATARYLTSGPNRLAYQVYLDAARTQIFGDGSGGTRTISGSAFVFFTTNLGSATLYPVIPAGQNPAPGSYGDTLTVQMTF